LEGAIPGRAKNSFQLQELHPPESEAAQVVQISRAATGVAGGLKTLSPKGVFYAELSCRNQRFPAM